MKSFQKFIEAMDTGLRGGLEKSGLGGASFNPKQEEAIVAVTDMIMMVASEMPSKLISFLKSASSSNPEMAKVFNKFEEDHLVNALHAAAVNATKNLKSDEEKSDNDNLIAVSQDDPMRHGAGAGSGTI